MNAGNPGIPAFRAPKTLSSSSTAHLPSQLSTPAPQDALDRQGLCRPRRWVLKVSPEIGHLHSRSISPHPTLQITAKPLPGDSPIHQLSAVHRTAFSLKNAWTYWLKIKKLFEFLQLSNSDYCHCPILVTCSTWVEGDEMQSLPTPFRKTSVLI